MENCVFCKIISNEIPSYKVWEDDQFMAFLSSNPHNPGHTLVVPKKHVDYFFDVEDDLLRDYIVLSKKLAGVLKETFNPKSGKVGVVVAGLEVAHSHLHLIPMNEMKDLDFDSAKHDTTPEEFTQTLEKIKEKL